MEEENKKLKNRIHDLEEQLENYIPRRKVRRVYKELKKILEEDMDTNIKEDAEIIKRFIKRIEVAGKAEARTRNKNSY